MVQKINKKFIILIILFLVASQSFFAQVLATQQDIKFPVWVLLEGVPSLEEKTDESQGPFTLAATRVKETVPFILQGMIYGWDFSYTPYDASRGVKEYFEMDSVGEITLADKNISFSEMSIDDAASKLTIWVTYKRTEELFEFRKHWDSVLFPKVRGEGSAPLTEGIEGLKTAYKQSVLNAVREYARKIEKNKPKEIKGAVLISDYPWVSVQSGRYVVKLELILEIDEILSYSVF